MPVGRPLKTECGDAHDTIAASVRIAAKHWDWQIHDAVLSSEVIKRNVDCCGMENGGLGHVLMNVECDEYITLTKWRGIGDRLTHGLKQDTDAISLLT